VSSEAPPPTTPTPTPSDVRSDDAKASPPGEPRSVGKRRRRWRTLVWGTALLGCAAVWFLLLGFGADLARTVGAWIDLALIVLTALVVEGFVAALLDGLVDGVLEHHLSQVAATSWSACSRCGGRVPFAADERQARCPYCDGVVLPATGRRAILGVRALLIGLSLVGLLVATGNWAHAPLMPPKRVALVLVAACVGAIAWPFRRYARNQPG
jgi:hypothetical protein